MEIKAGLTGEHRFVVSEADTAAAIGGTELPAVLSTPRLVSLLETTAHQALAPYLEDGQSSVGVTVTINHMAATPVGMQARVRLELLAVEGRRLRFKVDAWDQVEKIAEGEHERFIIDVARFNQRVEKKREIESRE